MKIPREPERLPRRSPFTAGDGRPICPECDEAYTPLRIVITLDRVQRPASEPCQSCKQKRLHRERKAARGW